nr:MAG TPA: hypothetical protein [Caudoviricetes sp.]
MDCSILFYCVQNLEQRIYNMGNNREIIYIPVP